MLSFLSDAKVAQALRATSLILPHTCLEGLRPLGPVSLLYNTDQHLSLQQKIIVDISSQDPILSEKEASHDHRIER